MNKNFSLPSIKVVNENEPASSMATTFNTTQKNYNSTLNFNSKNTPSQIKNSPVQEEQSEKILKGQGETKIIQKKTTTTVKSPSGIVATVTNFNNEVQKKGFSLDKLRNKDKEQEKQEEERDVMSRETMFRFYSKDTDKLKRLKTPGYIGLDPYLTFYKKYKNVEKEIELGNGQGYSPCTAFLNKIQSLKVLPTPLGLLSHKGDPNTIQAKNLKLGRSYASALSHSMKHLQNAKIVDLPGNMLGMKGGQEILNSMNDKVRVINLANNDIRSEGLKNLIHWIDLTAGRCQLEILNLESNNFGDDFVVDLVESLIRANAPIKDINFSHNNIGDRGAISLSEIFSTFYHLKCINISWNKIQGKGGCAIADALKDNIRIQYFDGSFNSFGMKRDGKFGQKIGDACNNGSIRHIDISYNSMDKKECEIFGQAIHDNHTLWGLHMIGNECILDSMGFIRAGQKQIIQSRDILYSPANITGVEFISKFEKQRNMKLKSYQHCWVCEGWSEKKFEWKSGISGNKHEIAKEPVYIHFDFDHYKPWLMTKVSKSGADEDDDSGYFEIYHMVPPGRTNYFYSFGGENGVADAARDQPHFKPTPTAFQQPQQQIQKQPILTQGIVGGTTAASRTSVIMPSASIAGGLQNFLHQNVQQPQYHISGKFIKHIPFVELVGEKQTRHEFEVSFQLRVMNFVTNEKKRVLDNFYDPVKFEKVVPRLSDQIYIRPVIERPRTPWSFPISIFKDYQIENDAKIQECFEFDYSNMKFPKMSEEEQSAVKEELRNAYKTIKETYKYLSSIGSNGNVFAIPLNCYTDFVKQINLVDGNIIKFAQSDTEFITMNKRTKASPLNPGVALVRFQLMEILMRLAFKRYEETKEAQTKSEAVKMMYEKNLLPNYGHLNLQTWRDERYWNEEVDNVYKAHFPIFDQLYKIYGQHYLKPGDKPFMMSDEFENLMQACGFVNDNFVGRDCTLSFNGAMMTQVNELDKDRHLKALFVEFLEAYGRACEKMSLPPFIEDEQSPDDDPLPLLTDEERINQPLWKKIYNSLQIVYANCMSNTFKEKWTWPKVDPKTNLFKDRYFKKKKKTEVTKGITDMDLVGELGEGSKEVIKSIFE